MIDNLNLAQACLIYNAMCNDNVSGRTLAEFCGAPIFVCDSQQATAERLKAAQFLRKLADALELLGVVYTRSYDEPAPPSWLKTE